MRKPTPEQDELLLEIKGLRKDLKDMTKRAETAEEKVGLQEQIAALESQQTELRKKIELDKIERDRQVEKHEREKRELEHYIGLEKKRQEFEIDQAKRETEVAIREGNLATERDVFDKNLKFNNERFEKTEKMLREFCDSVLNRLPTVTVDRQITESTSRTHRQGKATD